MGKKKKKKAISGRRKPFSKRELEYLQKSAEDSVIRTLTNEMDRAIDSISRTLVGQ